MAPASMGPRSHNLDYDASSHSPPSALLQWVQGRITLIMENGSLCQLDGLRLQWVQGRITLIMAHKAGAIGQGSALPSFNGSKVA